MIVALTFDVDCQKYIGAQPTPFLDELEVALETLDGVFARHPDWRATWFLRLDSEIDMFDSQAELLSNLLELGHALAWHFHGPTRGIAKFAAVARHHGLDVSRIGFGLGSNELFAMLTEAGFSVDSTAMPRPRYAWSKVGVDWSTSPDRPYRPSLADYRVPGDPGVGLLEIPISCTTVAAPQDTQSVVRYMNPAYHPAIFQRSLEGWMADHDHLVTITHPYELTDAAPHGLLAFDAKAFEENVMNVEAASTMTGGCEFVTVRDMAERHLREAASA